MFIQTLLKKKIEVAVVAQNNRQVRTGTLPAQANGEVIPADIKTCVAMINIYHMIQAASSKLIEPLTSTTLKGEKSLYIEVTFTRHLYRSPVFSLLISNMKACLFLY